MPNQIQNTAVEFFISKSLEEALAVNGVNPGSICFVTDNNDHYIVLNGEIYGGVTQLELNKIPVTRDEQGVVTSTLADYFDNNGVLQSKQISIVQDSVDGFGEHILDTVITLNSSGIYIGNSLTNANKVLTSSQIEALIQSSSEALQQAIANAVTSIYRVKGSVTDYNALLSVTNPKVGDVYNVVAEVRQTITDQNGNILEVKVWAPGTNFVCKSIQESQQGTEIEWDALGGTFDSSLYYTKTQANEAIGAAEGRANAYTDSKISEVTVGVGSLQALANRVSTNETNIATNTTNITTLNNRLTWQ